MVHFLGCSLAMQVHIHWSRFACIPSCSRNRIQTILLLCFWCWVVCINKNNFQKLLKLKIEVGRWDVLGCGYRCWTGSLGDMSDSGVARSGVTRCGNFLVTPSLTKWQKYVFKRHIFAIFCHPPQWWHLGQPAPAAHLFLRHWCRLKRSPSLTCRLRLLKKEVNQDRMVPLPPVWPGLPLHHDFCYFAIWCYCKFCVQYSDTHLIVKCFFIDSQMSQICISICFVFP